MNKDYKKEFEDWMDRQAGFEPPTPEAGGTPAEAMGLPTQEPAPPSQPSEGTSE